MPRVAICCLRTRPFCATSSAPDGLHERVLDRRSGVATIESGAMDVAESGSPLERAGGRRVWRALVHSVSGGIGLRLLAGVLLVSSTVTLALTALQFYLDYRREIGVIETRLDEIGRSSLGSLSESLW